MSNVGKVRKTPYSGLPRRQFWKQDPGIDNPDAFNPVSDVPFHIAATDKVVTAGSCFAQHVGRRLSDAGYCHYITETAHPIMPEGLARQFNYGTFAARYGNVYTARQLLQLLRRAWGEVVPLTTHWPQGTESRVVDPFRPRIQPQGFVSAAELAADQVAHFAAIRRAVETMDVFVFTLGLTECWEDPRDGMVFPIAPGVSGGVWEPDAVVFRNFDEQETAADLIAALTFIRARNPAVRIILTVSPVPLNATYEKRHVFESTTWSKAVLRIAAERARRAFAACVYFPSYEIITAPHVRGRYYAPDCREVLPEGVDHVMRLFLSHFGKGGIPPEQRAVDPILQDVQTHMDRMQSKIDVFCDEQSITRD